MTLRFLIPYLLTAILTAGLSYGAYLVRLADIERDQQKALSDQKTALTAQCETAQRLTKETSHEFQNQLSDLNRRYAAALRLRRPECTVLYSPDTPAGRDAASRNTRLSEAHGTNVAATGISTAALLQFAKDAEQVGLQLDGCQAFLRGSNP